MIKFYQFHNRAITNLLYFFGLKKTFVIYAPQRSFSNFFRQLMELNIYINYEQGKKNNNYYKHNPKVKLDTNIRKKFIIFVLYKEFDLWYESLKKNPMDFFKVSKDYGYQFSSHKEKTKLKKYHYNFYSFWIQNQKKISNIEFIDYRDFLHAENIYKFIGYIKNKYKLLTKKNIKIPVKIRFSKKLNKKKILKNLKKKDRLSRLISRAALFKCV